MLIIVKVLIRIITTDTTDRYGLYHELVTHDVVKAEHMYTRALVQCPRHKNALE